jgi:hypothetical protein
MIEILVIAGLSAAAGLWAARRNKQVLQTPTTLLPPPAPKRREITAWDLLAGDVVIYATEDFVVERILTYEEEGPRFREAVLTAGASKARLLVIPRQAPILVKPIEAPDGASSMPDHMNYDNREYRLLRRGDASIQGERWQYADYEAPPGRFILLRKRPTMVVKVFAGEQVSAPGLLEFMPGS